VTDTTTLTKIDFLRALAANLDDEPTLNPAQAGLLRSIGAPTLGDDVPACIRCALIGRERMANEDGLCDGCAEEARGAAGIEPTTVRIMVNNEVTSGRRKGWHKHVAAIDKTKRNGFAFQGEFLDDGLHDLPAGSLVLQVNPTGSVKNSGKEGILWRIAEPASEGHPGAMADDGGPWQKVAKVDDWRGKAIVLRDEAAKILG